MHITMTPPNPPPHKSEHQKLSMLERSTIRILRVAMAWINILPGLAEAVVIIAMHARPNGLSKFTLSTLTRSLGAPESCTESIALTPYLIFAFALAAFGAYIRLWCYRTLGRLFTFELALRPDHELVTSGPYAIVRHPGYTGGILALAGFSLAHTSPGSWARECGALPSVFGLACALQVGLSVAIILERCGREDKVLKRRFGRSWEVWNARVRWKVLPGIF
ncbi:ICMT-domain-containing protein [Leucogyrophana mollusca]|uniref:ICMT-domain-containing protein n=1 Tax=Leucogyrophana mollusca TaxID=85980 RepID=A0ACB8BPK9_9AGAM|nr:ICMT-domain-containing protein [Leucogyrophana mollusca]